MNIDIFELSPERVGAFDIVLLLGVLYHLRDPLLALDHVASVTKELLIVETEADMLYARRPAAAFYPRDELHKDPTNWWGPNPAALRGMLKSVGFGHVQLVTRRSFRSF
jgi:tRNA (mo5U34)-methyltransferase